MRRSIATDAGLLVLGITLGFAGALVWIKPQADAIAPPTVSLPVPQPAPTTSSTKSDGDIELFNQLMIDLPLLATLRDQENLDASRKEMITVSLEVKVLNLHRAFIQLKAPEKKELAIRLLENSSMLLNELCTAFNKERHEFWRSKPNSEQIFNAFEFLGNVKNLRQLNRSQF